MGKKDTTDLCLCVDYWALNSIMVKNCYPLPLIDILLEQPRKACYFTCLDLQNTYHLIWIKAGDEWLTAFKTCYGLFEYLVMPFGLVMAPATFQSFIDWALGDLINKSLVAYLDDILIYGDSITEVQERTWECLAHLEKVGLYIKLEKCKFEVEHVNFLGFIIGQGTMRMDSSRINTITKWPAPNSVKDIQSFIGFCNFYHQFIEGFSCISWGLTQITQKEHAKKPFKLTPEAQISFTKLKHAFTQAPLLRQWDQDLPGILETDASGYGISGTLLQLFDGVKHPVAFYSCKMNPAEMNYGTPD